MMRRQLRMFGLFFCVMIVLCASYAEGHMIYSDEDGVTDFNSDGKTDFVDFIMFVAAFGSQQIQFDLNQNGLVDFPDFLVFISAFGQPGSGSSGGTHSDVPVSAQAFQHFADRLNIRWDDDFLYIESNAFPNHRMMVGITAWNQQVPLPQPYQGDNAWQIPLEIITITARWIIPMSMVDLRVLLNWPGERKSPTSPAQGPFGLRARG